MVSDDGTPTLAVVDAGPNGGALSLLSRLISGHDRRRDETRDTRGERHDGCRTLEGPGPHLWTLDTKYYTANVTATISTLPAAPAASAAAPSNPRSHAEGTDNQDNNGDDNTTTISPSSSSPPQHPHPQPPPPASPEALVLVYDPTIEGALRRVTAYATQPGVFATPPEIRLLVCMYPDVDAVAADGMSEARRADEWAVENGYEAVAVLAVPTTTTTTTSKTPEAEAEAAAADASLTLDGDAQGTGRVRAALEAHMWPGLVMKAADLATSSGGGGARGAGSGGEADGDGDGESESAEGRRGMDIGGQDSACKSAEGADVQVEDVAAPQKSTVGAEPVVVGAAASRVIGHGLLFKDGDDHEDSVVGGGVLGGGDGGGMEDDGMDDELELMIAEMARVRAMSAGASDLERRAAAAETAMKMMRLFADGGDDGDDDGDGDDESDEKCATAAEE